MAEACAIRAREEAAREAEKEANRGTSTSGTKWGTEEVEKFKSALARLGRGLEHQDRCRDRHSNGFASEHL